MRIYRFRKLRYKKGKKYRRRFARYKKKYFKRRYVKRLKGGKRRITKGIKTTKDACFAKLTSAYDFECAPGNSFANSQWYYGVQFVQNALTMALKGINMGVGIADRQVPTWTVSQRPYLALTPKYTYYGQSWNRYRVHGTKVTAYISMNKTPDSTTNFIYDDPLQPDQITRSATVSTSDIPMLAYMVGFPRRYGESDVENVVQSLGLFNELGPGALANWDKRYMRKKYMNVQNTTGKPRKLSFFLGSRAINGLSKPKYEGDQTFDAFTISDDSNVTNSPFLPSFPASKNRIALLFQDARAVPLNGGQTPVPGTNSLPRIRVHLVCKYYVEFFERALMPYQQLLQSDANPNTVINTETNVQNPNNNQLLYENFEQRLI